MKKEKGGKFHSGLMDTIIMQHHALLILDNFCLYCFMFLMCAFMEELNCRHLVWYVYDELIGLSTLFACFSWNNFWDWFWRSDDGWSVGYIGADYGTTRGDSKIKWARSLLVLWFLVFCYFISNVHALLISSATL